MNVNHCIFVYMFIVPVHIYQGSPFVSVYYVHYILLETLARYMLDAC